MNRQLISAIITQDNSFYRQQAHSFAQKRQKPWPGWKQLPLNENISVLDVACGTGRFAQFLSMRLTHFQYLGIDASRELWREGGLDDQLFQPLDILASYQADQSWTAMLPSPQYDLILISGFYHHLPRADWRRQLIADAWDLVSAGGQLVVSFWQFEKNLPQLIVSQLGPHDYWLSWQGDPTCRRFAHQATETEINELTTAIAAHCGQVVADYLADGRTGELNRYLIWRKKDCLPAG